MNLANLRRYAIFTLGFFVWFVSRGFAQQYPIVPIPATGEYRIAGTVVRAAGGTPLSRARVYIADDKDQGKQRTLVTGDDGRFSFTQIPAGKYSLAAAKRGFVTAAYDQHEQFATAIVTGAGLDTENLTLRLQPAAMLTGKVLDEAGEPVRGANVTLYREDHRSGVSQVLRSANEETDDQGAYEFAFLAPGTYFVSASARPWYAVHPPTPGPQEAGRTLVDPALDVAYQTTYYEDSADPDEALPIPIKGGDRLEVTLHLTPVPALRLQVHVDGNGEHGFTMPNFQQPSLDGTDYVPTNGAQMISPGQWEISGVPAGKYIVRMPSQDGNTAGSEMEMSFTSDGEELDVSKAETDAAVKAQVKMAGDGPLPANLSVELLNSKQRPAFGNVINAKGEVEIPSVTPGRYSFYAIGPNKAYSVIAVSDHGHTLANHAIDVAAGSTSEVTLTIAEGNATVEGFARKNGKPAAGAMVVLVPQNPESNRELFRRDQSDQDGSFAVRGVAPGSYTVVAIEDGWDLDWSTPAVIAYYLRHGMPVTISAGQTGLERLGASVEVQSK